MPLSSDFSKFSHPLQPYINGEFIDSVGAEKHTLISAVNDQVITKVSKEAHIGLHKAAAITIRKPYSITAGICAYNAPLGIYAIKAGPALPVGNVIIIKASETNPLSTLLAVSLASQAGIPNGIIRCITGGLKPGKALVAVAKRNLKSITLKLSSKSPVVVFPDADLDKAAQNIAGQLFILNAKVCSTGSRIYTHESIVDELVAKMKGLAWSMRKLLDQYLLLVGNRAGRESSAGQRRWMIGPKSRQYQLGYTTAA
ncbi:Aldehyde/histidinol dehydrogenase [Fusarium redolens]|uniref:aldehyde dehydrogenase (NAD(+)) n=1 Tax=Fusarium redolens TaxID=48865 RepID=A0A9P9JQ47_FUSRE|nr:Aldehyde/histidinol dehydrogenase [Fusarium redolens]KAH7207889.1 Aldehyde/histidinol dehydrogenase [Fusarium redolens]